MRRFDREFEPIKADSQIQAIISLCEDISMEDFSYGTLDDKLELIILMAGGRRKP